MPTDATWRSIREGCEALAEDEVFVTPGDERVFEVVRMHDDRVDVAFREGRERTLRREQFDVLEDAVDDGLAAG